MEDLQKNILLSELRVLLIEEKAKNSIVIGAPHHSPGGVEELPCPEHKAVDENTGFIARQIAEALEVSCIIACNYFIDPNKGLQTDYSIQIAKWQPRHLIEIHGHGGKSAGRNEIEISCGSSKKKNYQKCLQKHYKQSFISTRNSHPLL